MFGHIVMHDSPTVVGENDQNKQDAKRSSGHHEEVDGDQVIDMIIQEGSPRLGGRFPLSRHQSGDRPFRDLNPQFLQFPVDSRTSPEKTMPEALALGSADPGPLLRSGIG